MHYSDYETNRMKPVTYARWNQAEVDAMTLEAELHCEFFGDPDARPSNPDEESDFERWKAQRLSSARSLAEAQVEFYV